MKMEQWRLSSLKLTSSFLTLLQRHPDIHWTLLKICLKSQGRILTIPTAFMYFFPFFNPRFDLHLNFYPLLHLVFKTWNHRDRAFYRLIFLGFPTMSIFVYFCCLVAKSGLCDPMDSSLLDFSVHGISQAKILEGVAISFSRNQTFISCIVRRILSHWATREAPCVFYTHSVAQEMAPLFLRGSDVYTVKSLRLH